MGSFCLERCINFFISRAGFLPYSAFIPSVGYDAKRADRKRRKTETYERPVGGLGLNIAENDNLHVPHEVGEVSIKIECGCCFDDECSFVCGLSIVYMDYCMHPNGRLL